jgi:hypothetical protein
MKRFYRVDLLVLLILQTFFTFFTKQATLIRRSTEQDQLVFSGYLSEPNVLKPFTAVIYECSQLESFQPSLMFASKAEHLKGSKPYPHNLN